MTTAVAVFFWRVTAFDHLFWPLKNRVVSLFQSEVLLKRFFINEHRKSNFQNSKPCSLSAGALRESATNTPRSPKQATAPNGSKEIAVLLGFKCPSDGRKRQNGRILTETPWL
jgi:hypothetical protein